MSAHLDIHAVMGADTGARSHELVEYDRKFVTAKLETRSKSGEKTFITFYIHPGDEREFAKSLEDLADSIRDRADALNR